MSNQDTPLRALIAALPPGHGARGEWERMREIVQHELDVMERVQGSRTGSSKWLTGLERRVIEKRESKIVAFRAALATPHATEETS